MTAMIDDVLTFWFGIPAQTAEELMGRVRRWFMGGPELDAEVTARFGPLVDAAVRGELDGWAATPRGRLALVIVLDQLTRNAYRGNPKTYAGDARAQALATEAFDSGLDAELSYVERLFLSMPLLHSERIEHHERLASIARALDAAPPPLYAKMSEMHREQVAKYHDVVSRFGRFPHRNAILGRTSTPEEEAFLTDWAKNAPPAAMRAARV